MFIRLSVRETSGWLTACFKLSNTNIPYLNNRNNVCEVDPFCILTNSGCCESLFKILVISQEWIEDSDRKHLPFIQGYIIEDAERGSEVVKHVIKERRPNIKRDS